MKTIKDELSILHGNLLVIIVSSVFIRFSESIVTPFQQLFLRELGASPSTIGIIGSVSSAILIFTRIPGGYIADKHGRKRIIVVGTIVYAFSYLFYVFGPTWEYVVIGILISYLCTVYTPAFSALVADSIPPERMGVGYALRNMIPNIATIFAPAIGGLLVKEYGIVTGVKFGYAIVIGFYIISIIIRGKYLEETLEGTEPFEPKHVFSLLTESFVSIPEVWRTMPNNFKNYLAATLLSAFTGPLVFPLMAFYAVDVIGITSIQWGYLGTIGIAVNLLASYPLGKLVDRIPRKTAIIISYISWLPILGLFIVSRSYNSLVIFFILDALNRALSMPAFLGMIADLVPRDSRGRIGSVERTLGSIVSTLAFAVSGFLYQSNPVYPFTIALVLESITLLLVIFILKEPESREV